MVSTAVVTGCVGGMDEMCACVYGHCTYGLYIFGVFIVFDVCVCVCVYVCVVITTLAYL